MTPNGSAACMSAVSPGAKKEARPAMCSVSVVTSKSLQDIRRESHSEFPQLRHSSSFSTKLKLKKNAAAPIT